VDEGVCRLPLKRGADGQQLVHAEKAHRYCAAVQQYVPKRKLLLAAAAWSRSHAKWRTDGRVKCLPGWLCRAYAVNLDGYCGN
jgi:hypothetical protein